MKKVFIIAEAGVNHNGSMELAKKLIDAAVYAGVDAVKFQSFKADKLASKNSVKAKYQIENTGNAEETQYEMLKKLELSYEDHIELKNYCLEKNILFLSSAFDLDSIDVLEELKIPLYKVPSGEINNVPYLRKIARTGKPVIISTGMCEMEEIQFSVDTLKEAGCKDITILHCNTEYPTPMKDVNLKAMNHIKDVFKVKVGYSDHTLGIEIPTAAVALGAEVIEKHFTLDKTMEGPDHVASLEPEELKAMVEAIRNIEAALGTGVKAPSKSEVKNKEIARKSIVARIPIKAGEELTEDNLIIKRPGNGLSPMMWDKVIGTKASKDYVEDEMIVLWRK